MYIKVKTPRFTGLFHRKCDGKRFCPQKVRGFYRGSVRLPETQILVLFSRPSYTFVSHTDIQKKLHFCPHWGLMGSLLTSINH